MNIPFHLSFATAFLILAQLAARPPSAPVSIRFNLDRCGRVCIAYGLDGSVGARLTHGNFALSREMGDQLDRLLLPGTSSHFGYEILAPLDRMDEARAAMIKIAFRYGWRLEFQGGGIYEPRATEGWHSSFAERMPPTVTMSLAKGNLTGMNKLSVVSPPSSFGLRLVRTEWWRASSSAGGSKKAVAALYYIAGKSPRPNVLLIEWKHHSTRNAFDSYVLDIDTSGVGPRLNLWYGSVSVYTGTKNGTDVEINSDEGSQRLVDLISQRWLPDMSQYSYRHKRSPSTP